MSKTMWANLHLLDRVIISSDDEPVGMVDDIELSDPKRGADAPEVTALLCGPTALGPRIGGTIGLAWLGIGRRLRPSDDPYPNRLPLELVDKLDQRGVYLTVKAEDAPTRRFRGWVNEKIVKHIPGSGA